MYTSASTVQDITLAGEFKTPSLNVKFRVGTAAGQGMYHIMQRFPFCVIGPNNSKTTHIFTKG